MSRPIPRKMLPHTATYRKRTGVDRYQNPEYAPAVTLRYVRVELVHSNANQAPGEMDADKAVLFYDTTTSLPVNITFEKGDSVTFGGAEFTVREAEKMYGDFARVHHWELRLT